MQVLESSGLRVQGLACSQDRSGLALCTWKTFLPLMIRSRTAISFASSAFTLERMHAQQAFAILEELNDRRRPSAI